MPQSNYTTCQLEKGMQGHIFILYWQEGKPWMSGYLQSTGSPSQLDASRQALLLLDDSISPQLCPPETMLECWDRIDRPHCWDACSARQTGRCHAGQLHSWWHAAGRVGHWASSLGTSISSALHIILYIFKSVCAYLKDLLKILIMHALLWSSLLQR